MSSESVKWETGNWKVVRDCCTSGNCETCRRSWLTGVRARVVQGSNYSERYARYVAKNWARYNAVAKENSDAE